MTCRRDRPRTTRLSNLGRSVASRNQTRCLLFLGEATRGVVVSLERKTIRAARKGTRATRRLYSSVRSQARMAQGRPVDPTARRLSPRADPTCSDTNRGATLRPTEMSTEHGASGTSARHPARRCTSLRQSWPTSSRTRQSERTREGGDKPRASRLQDARAAVSSRASKMRVSHERCHRLSLRGGG